MEKKFYLEGRTVALAFDSGVWSREKEFKEQPRVKVLSTEELVELLES